LRKDLIKISGDCMELESKIRSTNDANAELAQRIRSLDVLI
jgi:cell division protein FtsL